MRIVRNLICFIVMWSCMVGATYFMGWKLFLGMVLLVWAFKISDKIAADIIGE